MGMKGKGFEDYGLVFDETDLVEIIKKYDDKVDTYPRYWTEMPKRYLDNVLENLLVPCLDHLGEFTGTLYSITDDGREIVCDAQEIRSDMVIYIPIPLVQTLFLKPYRDIDDVINDFKIEGGDFLPKDFDFRNHIKHIVGIYYG